MLAPVARTRRLGRAVYDGLYCRRVAGKQRMGEDDHWHVCLSALTPQSTVVSAGVGTGISFELALARHAGCRIQLLDPTPTALHTMSLAENQHPLIDFRPVGLAGVSEPRSFAPPRDEAEGSYFVEEHQATEGVWLPCEDLATIMHASRYQSIDLLKMDIEGSEYEVVEQIISAPLSVRQLCVEFHPWLSQHAAKRTRQCLRELRRAGFRLIHRERNDYTFLLPTGGG